MKRLTRYEISATVEVRELLVVIDVVMSLSAGKTERCLCPITESSQYSLDGEVGLSMM